MDSAKAEAVVRIRSVLSCKITRRQWRHINRPSLSEACSFYHGAEIPQEVPGVKHARLPFWEVLNLTLTGHYSFKETIIISIMTTRSSVLAPFRLSMTRLVEPPDEPPRDDTWRERNGVANTERIIWWWPSDETSQIALRVV